jgi:hypothetical protein
MMAKKVTAHIGLNRVPVISNPIRSKSRLTLGVNVVYPQAKSRASRKPMGSAVLESQRASICGPGKLGDTYKRNRLHRKQSQV